MPSSGSYDYTQTRDQIIADSLSLIGVLRPGGTVSTADTNICSNFLNKLVKSWEGQGIHLWKETEGTVFLREDVNTYTLSASSSDQAGDNVVETTLSAEASSTSLTVTSTTGMTAADNIGIELDDGTRQWTTIVSVGSSTLLTITTGLTSVASSGNTVFTYTTHITKPLMITTARFRNTDGNDRPVELKSRDGFMNIPSKTSTGKINQIFYVPNISSGLLYVWPTPDDVSDRLKISYIKLIEDFDASADNADFPTEWLKAITYNLAVDVAPIYGKVLEKQAPSVITIANDSLINMQLWDVGMGSVTIAPADRFDD